MLRTYQVSAIHPISNPGGPTVFADYSFDDAAFTDAKTLGAALRQARILCAGTRVREWRVEGNRTIVFPTREPGGWHSITLTQRPTLLPNGQYETDRKGTVIGTPYSNGEPERAGYPGACLTDD